MSVAFPDSSRTTPFLESITRRSCQGTRFLWCKAVPLTIAWTVCMSLACLTSPATAQTDVEADPGHHRQLFENDKVRVVRVTYGPGEKAAAMFDAKEVVIVTLTAGAQRLYLPDGTFVDPPPFPAGAVFFTQAGRIQPANARDERLELIVVEPKSCK
jgi:hypothetical protein